MLLNLNPISLQVLPVFRLSIKMYTIAIILNKPAICLKTNDNIMINPIMAMSQLIQNYPFFLAFHPLLPLSTVPF